MKCTSSAALNRFITLRVGALPNAGVMDDAAAVLTPPPIVICPGTRPVINERFAGIGTAGGVAIAASARVYPKFTEFRRAGEKMWVSWNPITTLRMWLMSTKFGFVLGLFLSPSSIR